MHTASNQDIPAMTRGLVDYLRYFAASRQEAARDRPSDKCMVLLSDLPHEVVVNSSDRDGVLLTVEYPPMQSHPPLPGLLQGWLDESSVGDFRSVTPPELAVSGPASNGHPGDEASRAQATARQRDAPEVVLAYQQWRLQWDTWASAERRAQARRDLHGKLREMARSTGASDGGNETSEAVLAIGLLRRDDAKSRRLWRHVLTQKLSVSVDSENLSITVSLDRAESPCLEDRDFLEETDGYATDRSSIGRKVLEREGLDLLDDGTWAQLCRWAGFPFAPAVRCDGRYDAPVPSAGELTLTRTPAIILRDRDGGFVARYYDRIAAELKEPGASPPLGLAQLVVPLEHEQRLAWSGGQASDDADAGIPEGGQLLPLETNEAQHRVLVRMRSESAVVVQGPPGTGKTHTIANLICSLLSEGKRVLVTSEEEQALGELDGKLPKQLRELCVMLVDAKVNGVDELDQGITTLTEHLGSMSRTAEEARVQRLAARRKTLLAEMERLYTEIAQSREAEWIEHGEISPGYGGTPAQIAARVASNSPRFEWLYSLAPDFADLPSQPPLDREDALQLLRLLSTETDVRRTRRPQVVPAPDSMPAGTIFQPLAAAVREAEDLAARADDTTRRLAGLDERILAALEGHAAVAAEAIHRLRLHPQLDRWPAGTWQARYLQARLQSPDVRRPPQFDIAQREIDDARRQVTALDSRHVEILGLAPGELAATLYSGTGLRNYLLKGGRVRSPFLASRQQRAAKPFLNSCLIDGRPPTSAHDVQVVLGWLGAQAAADAHARRLESDGFQVIAGPLPARLDQLAALYAQLRHLNSIAEAYHAVDALLVQERIWLPLAGNMEEWDALCASIQTARILAAARQHRVDLDTFASSLPRPRPYDPPELTDLRRAAASADADGYAHARAALQSAYRDWGDQQRCDILLALLEKRHPWLAEELAATPKDPAWEERLRFLPEAWDWLAAKVFCERLSGSSGERDLQRKLDEVQQHVTRVTEDLAARRAWLHLHRTITQSQRQALASCRAAIAALGKGRGLSAEAKRREVRSAMDDALGAVPAWIMPIRKVAEIVPPQRNAFDVVIIDEASQAGIDAAFLLWLAPQVIAVGDDKQCAPGPPRRKSKNHTEQLSACLPTLIEHQRTALSPQSNLYELLSQRFPDPVQLKEHFRCMPEIIGWSSKTFYGESLIPLRQFGSDRLHPLRVVYVEDGRAFGDGRAIRNPPEAERLIATLQQLLDDTAYVKDPKTFAIIVLQGDGQVQVIESMLARTFSAEILDRHKIKVGTPPQFQGSEYDIVMLSMVAAKPLRASTARKEQRRINVAATRAREQMWLFTSARRPDLKPEDLRRSLLDYMESYAARSPAYLGPSPATDEVSPDKPHKSFESVFEQQVFREIRQRGYHVVPQFEVGSHRIDLVVSGSAGRIAVECDGRIMHADTARIREELQHERELRRVGWRFCRIRESEFKLDPDQALKPLWSALNDCGISPTAPAESVEAPTVSWTPVHLSDEEEDDDESGDAIRQNG